APSAWAPRAPQPHATAGASLFDARRGPPAAIAVTPVRPLGTSHCPESWPTPQPQATTVPSLFNATLCAPPAATAVTPVRPLGTLHCPCAAKPPQPQATTVPLHVACARPAGQVSRAPSAAGRVHRDGGRAPVHRVPILP